LQHFYVLPNLHKRGFEFFKLDGIHQKNNSALKALAFFNAIVRQAIMLSQ